MVCGCGKQSGFAFVLESEALSVDADDDRVVEDPISIATVSTPLTVADAYARGGVTRMAETASATRALARNPARTGRLPSFYVNVEARIPNPETLGQSAGIGVEKKLSSTVTSIARGLIYGNRAQLI